MQICRISDRARLSITLIYLLIGIKEDKQEENLATIS
jgi:hypothetical protein